jgi:hypothetical protein
MTGKFWIGVIVALIIGLGIGYFVPKMFAQPPAVVEVPTPPPVVVPPSAPAPVVVTGIPASQVFFQSAMRKLWEDHVTWTRLYIVDVAGNLPGKAITAARLMKNQEDIGNAMKAYYGEDAGNQLTALLKVHITGAVDILAAAKAGNQTKVDAASVAWYKNADDIAAYLSAANPVSWPLEGMKAGMKMHLDLTLAEAVDQLKGNFQASVDGYDKVHEHILSLADLLSAGIIKQFPDKFSQ